MSQSKTLSAAQSANQTSKNAFWLGAASALSLLVAPAVAQAKPMTPEIQAIVDTFPAFLRFDIFGIEAWQFMSLGVLLLAGLITRKIIVVVVISRVQKLIAKFGRNWADALADVFASPGATLAMAALTRVCYPRLGLPDGADASMAVFVRLLFTVSIVWAIYRLVDLLGAYLMMQAEKTESKLDDQLVPLVQKTLKFIVILAGGLFVLQNMNVDVGSLIAGLGIGGLAFALAAKDTIANLFGSVMIFLDRPFQIGDWVLVGDTEGVVEEVGFRSTRIRTFYNSLITVPNAVFTESRIDNFGEREYRRTSTTLGLTYDTTPEQMQAFVEGVRAVILANPYSRKDYFEVHMSGFGSHSLDVMLYFFFKVPSWTVELEQRHAIYLEIMRLAKDLDVQFAFPTQTMMIDYVNEPGKPRDLAAPQEPSAMAGVVHAFGPQGANSVPGGPRITEKRYLATAAPAAQSADDDG